MQNQELTLEDLSVAHGGHVRTSLDTFQGIVARGRHRLTEIASLYADTDHDPKVFGLMIKGSIDQYQRPFGIVVSNADDSNEAPTLNKNEVAAELLISPKKKALIGLHQETSMVRAIGGYDSTVPFVDPHILIYQSVMNIERRRRDTAISSNASLHFGLPSITGGITEVEMVYTRSTPHDKEELGEESLSFILGFEDKGAALLNLVHDEQQRELMENELRAGEEFVVVYYQDQSSSKHGLGMYIQSLNKWENGIRPNNIDAFRVSDIGTLDPSEGPLAQYGCKAYYVEKEGLSPYIRIESGQTTIILEVFDGLIMHTPTVNDDAVIMTGLDTTLPLSFLQTNYTVSNLRISAAYKPPYFDEGNHVRG